MVDLNGRNPEAELSILISQRAVIYLPYTLPRFVTSFRSLYRTARFRRSIEIIIRIVTALKRK